MAKKVPVKKTFTPKPAVKADNKSTAVSSSIFDGLEKHFASRRKFYVFALLLITILFSFLCFDTKISTANDDALYIEAGASYAKDFFGYFYLANAPLYPMILGLLIKIFGVKLLVLKLFSVVFFVAAIYVIFRAFENRIPYVVLIPSLLLTAINFPFLMYASLTYTETFSLLVFGACLWWLFRFFESTEKEGYQVNQQLPQFLIIGFLFFWMMITRNVALAAIGILAVFFIYRKRFAEAAASVVSFGIFYLLYRLTLKYIWKIDGSQFASQGKLMFQKDAYQPQLGNETMWGFVIRFWENCQIYISSRFYYVLGFREEMSPNSIALTLITIGILLWSLVLMHKKKQYTLIFTTLFYAGLLAVTFVSLHTSWGQTRLIMLFLPFMLFTFFYLIYYYSVQLEILQYLYLVVVLILFLKSFTLTAMQAKERFPVFTENIGGDATFGYTPDWQNYIKMTKWCAENLPKENIAVRKAPMSFIFSEGKEFYPIYNTPTENPDSLLIPLRSAKVNYIMPAELRANPATYIEGQIIGTVHRYMYYVMTKYPDAFEFVHQEGDLEKAQLYRIKWNYIDSIQGKK